MFVGGWCLAVDNNSMLPSPVCPRSASPYQLRVCQASDWMGRGVRDVWCVVGCRYICIYGSVCVALLQVTFETGQPLFLLSPGVVALARLALVENLMVVCVMCIAAYVVCKGRVNPVCIWFAQFCGLEELCLGCIRTSNCSFPPLFA